MESILKALSELGALDVDGDYEEDRIKFRLAIFYAEEWKTWINKFSEATNTCWNVTNTRRRNSQHVFKKYYICNLNQKRRDKKAKEARMLDTGCPARLIVTVNSPDNQMVNDKLNDTHPCVVEMIKVTHNHDLNSPDYLNQLRISESTNQLFFSYFDWGFSVSEAIKRHKTNLLQYQKPEQDGQSILNNRRINPSKRDALYMWELWKKRDPSEKSTSTSWQDLFEVFDMKNGLKSSETFSEEMEMSDEFKESEVVDESNNSPKMETKTDISDVENYGKLVSENLLENKRIKLENEFSKDEMENTSKSTPTISQIETQASVNVNENISNDENISVTSESKIEDTNRILLAQISSILDEKLTPVIDQVETQTVLNSFCTFLNNSNNPSNILDVLKRVTS